jgi:hypothetical protein
MEFILPLFLLKIYVKDFVIVTIFSKSIDMWLGNFAHLLTIMNPICRQEEITVPFILTK